MTECTTNKPKRRSSLVIITRPEDSAAKPAPRRELFVGKHFKRISLAVLFREPHDRQWTRKGRVVRLGCYLTLENGGALLSLIVWHYGLFFAVLRGTTRTISRVAASTVSTEGGTP